MERLSFHPLPLGDLIRRTFRLYGDALATVVLLALIAHLPLLLLGTMMNEDQPPDPLPALGLLVLILVVTGVVVNAIYLALVSHLVGRPAGVVQALRWSMRRSSGSVMLAYMISNLLSHAGLILFIVPGMIVGGLMAACVPATVAERQGGFAGIRRSVALLRRELMRGVGVFAFGTVVSELLPLQLLVAMQLLVGRSPYSPLLAALLAAITMPVALAANLLLYLSFRSAELGDSGADGLRAELQRLLPEET